MSDLLKNIFYGFEIDDEQIAMRWIRHKFGHALTAEAYERIYRTVLGYFSTYHESVFGGQITAGDGLFIAAFMEKVRPRRMIEIGVASGYSSAFILTYAKKMGLVTDLTFLTSFDLVAETTDGKRTGSFLRATYPELGQAWELHTEKTSVDLMQRPDALLRPIDGDTLAFIDGGHNHPWPTMDIACLSSILPAGSWIIMQDYQMMERWLADCTRFNVPCPYPVRGVNLAVTHWPGNKIIGGDLSYNCAAVQLDATPQQMARFAQTLLEYPYEVQFDREDLIRRLGVV